MSDLKLVHSWYRNIPNEDKEWKLTLKQNDTDLSWLYVVVTHFSDRCFVRV